MRSNSLNYKLHLLLCTCFLLAFGVKAQQKAISTASHKKVTCYHGAVVCAHPLASKAGVDILKKGGNAFDAAIATQLALAVVYPGAGNLGGGGFTVAHLNTGKNISLDYRETAPATATKNMFLDSTGHPVTGLSLETHLASGVPGTIAGLFATMKYAKFDFKVLITPAILLAENGFAITPSQAESLNGLKKTFLKNNRNPVAFVKDTDWKAGDILVQPELAHTLKLIRDQGVKGFYEGIVAKCIVEEMKHGNGIISYEDLKNYQCRERTANEFDYKQFHLISMPLPSSGGIILQQMMKMIEKRNIASLGFQTSASVQLMVEAERRAFADRSKYLGDGDFVKVPVKKLVSESYLQERMNDFIPGKAGNSKDTGPGAINESEETTHISIFDKDGNAVAITTTLNDSYGNKIVVSGAGFIMNNEMDDFSIKEGSPNMYGVTGSAANAIAPNKRMLSSMTPTIVFKNNLPYIIVGTPGGSTIPTSVFQTLINILEFNLSPADAVNKPKFHHQWLPDEISVEENYPVNVLEELTIMGYKIKKRTNIGRTEIIQVIHEPKKKIIAIADIRGDDDAEGY